MKGATDARGSGLTILEEFPRSTVLVIGDVMLDEYVWGDVSRISPEAPVPVVDFRKRTHALGGAANAAGNIAALGGSSLLAGVVGADHEAELLERELTDAGIASHLVASNDRPTTIKTRIVSGSQQLLRIDREERVDVTIEAQSSLLAWAHEHLPAVDCLLISDYDKGVVTRELCHGLIDLATAKRKPVVVDPKGRDFSKYEGATVITPNLSELVVATESLAPYPRDVANRVASLRPLLVGTAFVVTRGAAGLSLFPPNGDPHHLPARPKAVFDVTGAGDTFVATLSLGLAGGATLEIAAQLANAAASLVVGKVGTSTISLSELKSELAAG
jgi:D-beta-D-heptose 7-phosphate kinase/D-beta-D-heptose 1-phosphate adenosyltransferase